MILIRTRGVHLHTRGFTYSHLGMPGIPSHLESPESPNYTSSEGFTYRIIVIGWDCRYRRCSLRFKSWDAGTTETYSSPVPPRKYIPITKPYWEGSTIWAPT